MAKQNPPRFAVRKTPQPKTHKYVEAIFVDDYGRERSLTTSTAKSFSKKKLDAASRALTRKISRDTDRSLVASDRETVRAIRSLRAQERSSELALKRFYRRYIRTILPPSRKIAHKPPKPRKMIWPSSSIALPKYDAPIRDKFNRRSVFFRVRYYSSRTARPGVCKRVTVYIFQGAALDSDGLPMVATNVGLSIDEAVCGLDHLEQINRSAQKGAKVLNHAVLAMDHRWTKEQMLEVGEEWAEDCFGSHDLPFVISLHEPPPEGDQRNWHLHIVWSWRPLERIGDHEWSVGEGLRTDLDGADGIKLLREKLAQKMTEMSFRSGHPDLYTALSYAARGLPVEPQIHLDEGRTPRRPER